MAKVRRRTSRRTRPVELSRKALRERRPRVDVAALPIAMPRIAPGLFRRPEAAKRLSRAEIGRMVRAYGYRPTGGGSVGEPWVELSPAVPWVDGRGWLEAAGALQSWHATTTIGFYPDKPDQEQGVLKIWMDGLTVGDAYVAQIRVGGYPANPQLPGTFDIGASDAAHADVHHSGANQTISVFMPGVSGPLSLIRIDTRGLGGWLFDDVLISHLGPLA